MTDVFTKKEISALMSKIRGKDTGIELTVLAELKKRGIRGFERHGTILGRPDFVFYKNKVAIFCDGDFWHGYKFNSWKNKLGNFWSNKISQNIRRDMKVKRQLRANGWHVMRFWEHEIERNKTKCIDKIESTLNKSGSY